MSERVLVKSKEPIQMKPDRESLLNEKRRAIQIKKSETERLKQKKTVSDM